VITKHFDNKTEETDYRNTDNILYDWYIVGLRRPRVLGQEHEEITDKYRNKINNEIKQEVSNEIRGNKMITGKLRELVEADKLVFQTIDILKGGCIYCEFVPINRGAKEELYMYIECFLVVTNQVGY
jgi:hypothetical protein